MNLADLTNDQSEADTRSVVAAVSQVRQALDSLDVVELSELDDIRRLVAEVRSELIAADLSNVYQALMERLMEQRTRRQQLEMELGELSADIEHLRRINLALPNPVCGDVN